jgi:FeS assembly SUF system protein
MDEIEILKEQVISAIKTVYDPEIPVDVYELGLIYDIQITSLTHHVFIEMTLTSPACTVGQGLPGQVKAAVSQVKGIRSVHVELTFEPPYTQFMMSEAARLELGFM